MYWKPDPSLYPPFLRSRVRRGRGIGFGEDYVPWLKARDVPSIGTSSEVKGIKVLRPCHLLSEYEATYFFLIERKSKTIDIREQWPILDIPGTLELCAQAGVPHRYKGKYPEPFTIDFLITEKCDGKLTYRAASVKIPSDALNPDVQHRLFIEYQWCRNRGIPWTLVDTTPFDKQLLENLRYARGWFRHHLQPNHTSIPRFVDTFKALYRPNLRLSDLLHSSAKRLVLNGANAEDLFRYCVWFALIPVSLKHKISLDRPVVLSE